MVFGEVLDSDEMGTSGDTSNHDLVATGLYLRVNMLFRFCI